jgi:hypothetical protein
MQIELTENELRNLVGVLEQRLHELRHEIVHTAAHEFKRRLIEDEHVLQCLHDKLVTVEAITAA